jgi:Fic family protein
MYRYRAVLDYLHKAKKFVTANEVAMALGMSWNTAKKDLAMLSKEGYVVKGGSSSRTRFRFNFGR